MIINFPDAMTAQNWQDAHLPGQRALNSRNGSIFVIDWTYLDLSTQLTVDIQAKTIEIPDNASEALKNILQVILDDFGQEPKWAAGWRTIRDAAQSAVGKRVDQLTAADRNALFAVWLFQRKGLDSELKVKPLDQWVKRRYG